jgi:glycerate dehydrogenase
MKIVVLDGFTLNPGDLSWDAVKKLGELTVYDRSVPSEVVPRAKGAEVVLTNKTVLDKDKLAALPGLKYIGVLATGYNIVDVEFARQKGIVVTNVPTYGTASVAQMTFAHLLELTNRVGHHAREISGGKWCRSPDFCFWDYPQVELQGLTLGIVGFGRIGLAVTAIARAFGMKVLVYSVPKPENLSDGVELCGLDELFSRSDAVTLHCPLTPETKHIVNEKRLKLMKPTAYLINTSRGPLVDEQALADALNAGRLAGAGLDVLQTEPADPANPLLKAKNCYMTPHVSWATGAARVRLMETATENLRAFLGEKPQNVVSG